MNRRLLIALIALGVAMGCRSRVEDRPVTIEDRLPGGAGVCFPADAKNASPTVGGLLALPTPTTLPQPAIQLEPATKLEPATQPAQPNQPPTTLPADQRAAIRALLHAPIGLWCQLCEQLRSDHDQKAGDHWMTLQPEDELMSDLPKAIGD
jgi:hypothetical protein